MSVGLEAREEVRGLDALPPDALYEVIDGEARELQRMSAASVIVANELEEHLRRARRSRRDLVVTEMLFILPLSGIRRRRPDVAYVPEERLVGVWPPPHDDEAPAIAAVPALVAEVISPNDLLNEIEEKRIEYFEAGVDTVLIVYPKTRTIHVHQSVSRVRILTEVDTLELSVMPPGFSVRVADLFAPLNRPS